MRFRPFLRVAAVVLPGFLLLPGLSARRQAAPQRRAVVAADAPLAAWRTDLDAAEEEARRENKPLLVVFQCPRRAARNTMPDARLLHPENDPALSRLLARFVPVRVTSLKNVDLARYTFDYDLSFAVLITDPASGRTLARFGTRDEKDEAGRTRLSALTRAMRAALEERGRVGGAPRPPVGPRRRFTPDLYPVWGRTRTAQSACYHCHYAHDARILQGRAAGTFAKAELFAHPLPETVGITLDKDKNNAVRTVRPGSPAARAGVRAGDVIVRANGIAVYSSADLQFALDAVPDPGRVRLRLLRGERALPRTVPLALPAGWRTRDVDISWRASQGGVPPFLATWEEPLPRAERARRGLPPRGTLALRVTTLFAGEKWARLRGDLRVGDVIVGLDGRTLPDLDAPRFHTAYRLRYRVGDTAKINVLRPAAVGGDGPGTSVVVSVFCGDVPAE